jgi:flavin reductase (DIM6/NTAB) family NADH-FMN oxidoreductase RutF
MTKIKLESPQSFLFPAPAVLVGANVDGKPNFMAVAWCGVACSKPPMVTVAIRPTRHTYRGIRQNMAFSVNVPSVDLVKETDYCGITRGSEVNKVEVCKFNVFYGKLDNAPLIHQYPVNMECKVMHILELGSHALVVGRVEQTHISEECLTDGKPDISKIAPFSYIPGATRQYRALGRLLARSHSVGRKLEKK